MRTFSWIAIASIAAMTGCTVSAGDSVDTVQTPIDGTVTFDWSLNSGEQDNLVCQDFDADSIDIVIYRDGSATGTEFNDICESFVMTISLAPGNYSATAELLDVYGNSRTTPIDVIPFTIIEGTDVSIPLDFPADSFF